MSSLAEALVQISEQGVAAVLATVVEVEGGVPVEAGAKCLVQGGKARAQRSPTAKLSVPSCARAKSICAPRSPNWFH